jgi:DNA-binding response OmpR family regulator
MTNYEYHALIVDDEDIVLHSAARAFAAHGFSCRLATDGNVALDWIAEESFDVVLTDFAMPNKHGYALAVELLEREDRPLIVVLTAVLEPGLAEDFLARGVDDIVFKPVDYDFLAAKIKSLAKRRKSQQSQAAKSTVRVTDGSEGSTGIELTRSPCG